MNGPFVMVDFATWRTFWRLRRHAKDLRSDRHEAALQRWAARRADAGHHGPYLVSTRKASL